MYNGTMAKSIFRFFSIELVLYPCQGDIIDHIIRRILLLLAQSKLNKYEVFTKYEVTV